MRGRALRSIAAPVAIDAIRGRFRGKRAKTAETRLTSLEAALDPAVPRPSRDVVGLVCDRLGGAPAVGRSSYGQSRSSEVASSPT
ncbi:hypothetical protein GCM10022205_08080 [Spinactinospora alkalitolerans]